MTMEEWKQQQDEKAEKTAQWLDADDVDVKEPPKLGKSVYINADEEFGDSEDAEGDEQEVASANFGTISMILGILSILLGLFFAGLPLLGVLTGIGAIVLGAIERKHKRKQTRKQSAAGLACGIVGVILSIVVGAMVGAVKLLLGFLALFKF